MQNRTTTKRRNHCATQVTSQVGKVAGLEGGAPLPTLPCPWVFPQDHQNKSRVSLPAPAGCHFCLPGGRAWHWDTSPSGKEILDVTTVCAPRPRRVSQVAKQMHRISVGLEFHRVQGGADEDQSLESRLRRRPLPLPFLLSALSKRDFNCCLFAV